MWAIGKPVKHEGKQAKATKGTDRRRVRDMNASKCTLGMTDDGVIDLLSSDAESDQPPAALAALAAAASAAAPWPAAGAGTRHSGGGNEGRVSSPTVSRKRQRGSDALPSSTSDPPIRNCSKQQPVRERDEATTVQPALAAPTHAPTQAQAEALQQTATARHDPATRQHTAPNATVPFDPYSNINHDCAPLQMDQFRAAWSQPTAALRLRWLAALPRPGMSAADIVKYMRDMVLSRLKPLGVMPIAQVPPSPDGSVMVFLYCGLSNGAYVYFRLDVLPSGTLVCLVKSDDLPKDHVTSLLQLIRKHTIYREPTSKSTDSSRPPKPTPKFVYDVESLTWTDDHRRNAESKYCYCGTDKQEPCVQCTVCKQWFHKGCTSDVVPKDGKGWVEFQVNYRFTCKLCSRKESFELTKSTWLESILGSFQNLMWTTQRGMFKVAEITDHLDAHWDALCYQRDRGDNKRWKFSLNSYLTNNSRKFDRPEKFFWALANPKKDPFGPAVQPCKLFKSATRAEPPAHLRHSNYRVGGCSDTVVSDGNNAPPQKAPKQRHWRHDNEN